MVALIVSGTPSEVIEPATNSVAREPGPGHRLPARLRDVAGEEGVDVPREERDVLDLVLGDVGHELGAIRAVTVPLVDVDRLSHAGRRRP